MLHHHSTTSDGSPPHPFAGMLQGTLMIMLFGIGTAPALILVGKVVNSISGRMRRWFYQLASMIMIATGVWFVVEGILDGWEFAYYSVERVNSYILETNSEMSPTIFREAGFRFYFFSREEPRVHVHVQNQHGEAKFWLTPHLELAKSTGLSQHEITEAFSLITEHLNEIHNAWHKHFPC